MTDVKQGARAEVIIMVCDLSCGRGFHFCSIEKLQGDDCDLWFPLADPARLFEAVETVMQMNGIAHNVTDLVVISEYASGKDMRVRYNAA